MSEFEVDVPEEMETHEVVRLNLQDMILYCQTVPAMRDNPEQADIVRALRAKLLDYTDMKVRH